MLPLFATGWHDVVEEPAACEVLKTESPSQTPCKHGATDGGLEAGSACTPRHAKPAREQMRNPATSVAMHEVTDVYVDARLESADAAGQPRREKRAPARASGWCLQSVRPAREALRRARRTEVPKLCSGLTRTRAIETETCMALPLRLHGRRLADAFDPRRVAEILEATEAVWTADTENGADSEQNATEAGSRSFAHVNDDELPELQRECSRCVLCGDHSDTMTLRPTDDAAPYDGCERCILCGAPCG